MITKILSAQAVLKKAEILCQALIKDNQSLWYCNLKERRRNKLSKNYLKDSDQFPNSQYLIPNISENQKKNK